MSCSLRAARVQVLLEGLDVHSWIPSSHQPSEVGSSALPSSQTR